MTVFAGEEEPCVRWADTLVVSVHTRPRTLREEVSDLYYSRADEERFKREAETEPAPSLSPRRVRWADALVTVFAGEEEPCVRWADTLVVSVHTRPRTLREEVSDLYYSRADEERFKREAKTEPAPSLSPRRVRWADALVTQIPVISKRRILKAKHPSRISEVDRVLRRCCSVEVLGSRSHDREMELARPRAKRSRNASAEEFVGEVCAKLMAVSPVGTNSVEHSASPDDSEDESDSEDDGSDLFFLDNSGSDDESLKLSYSDSEDELDSEDDGSEWYFLSSPISDNSGYSEDDDVDNRSDDPMDISGNLPPLSISGAAREVPPRETSTKGRRLRKSWSQVSMAAIGP